MADRDHRTVKTPPAGVRVQTAAPLTETHEADDLTPLPQTTREAISAVGQRVKTASLGTFGAIDSVRRELKEDIGQVASKVDQLSTTVTELAVSSAALGARVGVLMEDREEFREVRTETVRTELRIHESREISEAEVTKARELAAIADAKARKEQLRQIVLKVLAAIGAVWGMISAAMMSRGC